MIRFPRRLPLLPALLACLLALSAVPASAEITQAPAWKLKTPDGKTVSYPEDAQGQPTVLLFWPSWCPFSRALQPYVQDIWQDYRDAGVKVWTINILERGTNPVTTMRERGLSFPLLVNGDPLVATYGIVRTPWFVVIDGQGRIVYTRPATAPSPVDVAKKARETLNGLLGDRAVPLPASYPAPYDLHLRKRNGDEPSRLESAAVADAEWFPWAEKYLAGVGAGEVVPGIPLQSPVIDGKTAILLARQLWSEAYGTEPTNAQAPYRALRKGPHWLVAGNARPGKLGQGFVLVIDAETGQVLRMREVANAP